MSLHENVKDRLRASSREDENQPLALDHGERAASKMLEVGKANAVNPGGMPAPPGSPDQASYINQNFVSPHGTHAQRTACPRPSAVNAIEETMLMNLWKSVSGAVLTYSTSLSRTGKL